MRCIFFQSYSLFTSGGADEPLLDLTSCLQVVGGRGQMDTDQFLNIATGAAGNCWEKVILSLVQDGIYVTYLAK